ncbi:MAG: DinB family protein [Planctomycetes bacterium]|nr:DinB family protein [Planctomycetota bacterium]
MSKRASVARHEEVAVLLRLLDEAYERQAWHGTNLRGSLRGVTASEAAWRPARGRHNVWERALHAAYWKYAVTRQLTGEKRGSFRLEGSNWFARPAGATSAKAWREDLAILDAEHRRLRDVVAALKPAALRQRIGRRYLAIQLITGAAMHDIYHAGQIQLLKRLRG